MNYANIKNCDIANGPGVRVSLFVSGCRHHCKGCFNAETWDFKFGQPYTKATEAEILELLKPDYIQGFTLLGGEPFEPENQVELVHLLKKIRETYPKKSIWCYTGYLYVLCPINSPELQEMTFLFILDFPVQKMYLPDSDCHVKSCSAYIRPSPHGAFSGKIRKKYTAFLISKK